MDVKKNDSSPSISQKSLVANLHSLSIPSEDIELVNSFYQRDDISRQALDTKDFITLRHESNKSKVQVRHLYNSVTEVFKLFQKDHPDIKIGRSKFAELRTKHVLPSNKLPHNVCLCKYHENFIGALLHLHLAYPDIFSIY